MKKTKINYFDILVFLMPIFGGLETIFSAVLLSLFSIVCLYLLSKKKKKMLLPIGIDIFLLLIYLVGYIVAELFAIDKGMNIMGLFKNLFLINFILIMVQENNEKTFLDKFRALPYSATISVFFSVLLALFSNNIFFANKRLQGIFLYANTYGLFLLISLLMLIQRKELNGKKIFMVITMLTGILFTNSRAIIILTLISIFAEIFITREKKNKKIILIFLICFVIFFAGIYKYSNLDKRINTEMFESGELLTRLLYYNDGIKMVMKKPFGYGYMGYYYAQATEKTAVYDAKYVHNFVLQLLLDVGIISSIAFLFFLAVIFLKKDQTLFSRFVIILIIVHSLIDIDFEYLIFLTIILGSSKYTVKEINFNNLRKNILKFFIAIWYLLHIGTFSFVCEEYDVASFVIPFYTDAIQEELYKTTDFKKQLEYGKRSLKYNKNVSGGYEALQYYYVSQNDYDKAIESAFKRVRLNKYDIYIYEEYIDLLNDAILYYKKENNSLKKQEYINKILQIEDEIKNVLKNTNKLAYRVQHVPNLEISEELRYKINMNTN